MSIENEVKIVKDYKNYNIQVKDILKKYNISYSVIKRILLKYNIEKRGSGRENQIPLSLFKDKNKERDYWIGYIIADGNVSKISKNRSRVVSIVTKDEEIVKLYKKYIGKYLGVYKRSNNIYTLYITSKKIATYLETIGIVPNKSNIIEYKEDINWNIFRGIFDGDGTVRKYSKPLKREYKITSGSEKLVNQLQKFLKNENIVSHINREGSNIYRLCVYNKENLQKTFDNMYYKNCPKLTRKYVRFDALLSN